MRRKSLLVMGAGVALLALTACGTANITGSAAPQGAGNHASAARGGNDGTQASTVAELGSIVSHNASKQNYVHVDMRLQAGPANITATGDMKFAGANSAVHLMMSLPGAGNLEMVFLDSVFYMKLPANLNPGGSKPWVKFDTKSTDPLSQALGSTAQLAQQSDPGQMIDKIKAAGTINKVTHEQVNGVDTTHYSINVDVRKLASASPMSDAQKQALATLPATMPFDLWLNSDNLPVRISAKTATPAVGGASATTVTVLANYSRWGQPVTITAPPADQVGSLGGN